MSKTDQHSTEQADDAAGDIWAAAVDRLPPRDTFNARWTRLRLYVQKFWEVGAPLSVETLAWYGSIVCLLPPATVFRVAKEFDYPARHRVESACSRILRECAASDLLPAGSAVAQ